MRRTYKRTGDVLNCFICGAKFYRRPSYVKRGIRVTCGKPECKSASMRGENNPFWGKVHDEETRKRIREGRRAHPPKNTGPAKGTFKHSPEARAAISEGLRRRWRENRDKMLAQFAHLKKEFRREDARYRRQFTPSQRRTWKDAQCAWCNSTEKLVLDHIIPVLCGGDNERRNAQTLCQPCNMWKMKHVDRPLLLAGLDVKRG